MPPIASILVVEDDPIIRQTLRRALEKAGYRVIEATTAGEGLRYIEARPQLVITEVGAGDGDGAHFIGELVRRDPDLSIIAMTGVLKEPDPLDIAQSLGASRTLRKPFSMQELLDAVRAELGRYDRPAGA